MKEIKGWNGNHPIFKKLIKDINPKTIIEIGSWHGQSAITMAKAVRELELETKIYCVDTWLGALEFMPGKDNLDAPVDDSRDLQKRTHYPSVFYTFWENVLEAGVEDIIVPVPQTSQIAALWFKREGITADLIYIDAGHDYKSVVDDVNAYLPLCTNTIFGDDYMNKDYQVKEAVDDVLFDVQVIDKNFWVCNK